MIVAVAGRAVSGPSDIAPIILAHKPGDKVTITYSDASGQSQSASVTLASGPPQYAATANRAERGASASRSFSLRKSGRGIRATLM